MNRLPLQFALLGICLSLSNPTHAISFFTRAHQGFSIGDGQYEVELIHRKRLHLGEAAEELERLRLAEARRRWRAGLPLSFGPIPAELKDDAFFRMAAVNDDPDVDATRHFSSQAKIMSVIFQAEKWKFDTFEKRNYLVPGRDDAFIQDVYENEPLALYDEIAIFYRYEPAPHFFWGEAKRKVVGLYAVSSQGKLLIEKRLNLDFERPEIEEVQDSSPSPAHSSAEVRRLAAIRRKRGGVIQMSSLVVDKEERGRLLPYQYFFAFWNGHLSHGQVLRENESMEIGGRVYTGPLVFEPTHVVIEGYGARTPLFKSWKFKSVPILGEIARTKGAPRRVELTVLGHDLPAFNRAIPQYLLDHSLIRQDMKQTELGSLTFRPRSSPLVHTIRNVHIPNEIASRGFAECANKIWGALQSAQESELVAPPEWRRGLKARVLQVLAP